MQSWVLGNCLLDARVDRTFGGPLTAYGLQRVLQEFSVWGSVRALESVEEFRAAVIVIPTSRARGSGDRSPRPGECEA